MPPKPARKPAAARKRKQKKPPKPQNSELSHVDLGIKNNKGAWAGALLARLVAIAIIVTAIVFGAINKVVALKARTMFGTQFDPDLQLGILGIFNKIMDLLVTTALQNLAGVLITLMMIRPALPGFDHGATLADFELKEELVKPWNSITAFFRRGTALGWRNAGWMRFLLTLVISICVLLQGLAINTLGYPKERWYPDTCCPITVTHPVSRFVGNGINWSTFWGSAWGLVGNGDPSWHVADGFIVARTLGIFENFPTQMLEARRGWQSFSTSSSNKAAIDTRYNGSYAQGLAAQAQAVNSVFDYLRANGSTEARAAIGWTGNVTLELPSATVHCGPFRNITGTGSVVVKPIDQSDTEMTTFEMSFTPLSARSLDQFPDAFAGANCNVTFRLVRYPFESWIVNDADTADINVNSFGAAYHISPVPLSTESIDVTIAKALSVQVQATTARLESLINGLTASQFFVTAARNLQTYRSDYNGSDIEPLAPLVAVMTNHLLSIGNWNVTYSNDYQASSSPIRYQLFGSGPRLNWEWIAVIVLAVLLIAVTTSLVFSLLYRISPGGWLKAGGMLVAANSSPIIETVQKAVGVNDNDKQMAGIHVYIADAGQGKAQVTDRKPKQGSAINYQQKYRWL